MRRSLEYEVHFGPQAAGKSGDWYARRHYVPGTTAYENHLKQYGHPSEVGIQGCFARLESKQTGPGKTDKNLSGCRSSFFDYSRRAP